MTLQCHLELRLISKIGSANPDPDVAALARDLLDKINGIGTYEKLRIGTTTSTRMDRFAPGLFE